MQFRGSSVTHTQTRQQRAQSTWRIPSADQLFIVWSIYWPLRKVVGIRSGGTNTQRFCQQQPSNPDSRHLDRQKPTVPFKIIQKLVLKDSSIRHLSYRLVNVITNRALELRWSICISSSTRAPQHAEAADVQPASLSVQKPALKYFVLILSSKKVTKNQLLHKFLNQAVGFH